MFVGPDPFLDVHLSPLSLAQGDDLQEISSIPRNVHAQLCVTPKHPQPAPQIAESSQMACEREGSALPTSLSIIRHLKIPTSAQSEGWYVVFHSITPGVSYGS